MTIRGYNIDMDLRLKDAGAITSSAAAQVSGNAAVLDLGAARFEGVVVVNVSALDLASANETYSIDVEFSNVAGMGSGVEKVVTVPVTATGYIEVPFVNMKYGTVYRYMRLTTTVGGTTPSINYTAHVAPLKWA